MFCTNLAGLFKKLVYFVCDELADSVFHGSWEVKYLHNLISSALCSSDNQVK